MIFLSKIQRRHASVLLKIFAEERRIGEVQIVGYLLHRHVSIAQTVLYSLQRIKVYHLTRTTVHRLLQQRRKIFRCDIQLVSEIVHLADTAVTLF